jgi:hypothetical protein
VKPAPPTAPRRHRAAPRGAACFALLVLGAATSAQERLAALFDGTLDGWSVENTADGNIAVHDGVLRVAAPAGWLKSAGRYSDFLLRIEFRFLTDDADSGIFVRALDTGPFGRGWPNDSYQVQLRNPVAESRFPAVGGIFRHGKPAGDTQFDAALAARVSTGTGEWQTLEIEAAGPMLEVRLNGTLLTRAAGIENPDGHIGIQAETGALEFRSIEIAERRAN